MSFERLIEFSQRDHDLAEVETECLDFHLHHAAGDISRADLCIVDKVWVDCNECQYKNAKICKRSRIIKE